MYRNLIFDLYGTLADFHSDERRSGVWKDFALFYCFNGAKYHADELRDAYFYEAKVSIESNHETRYPDIQIEKIFKKLYENKKIKPSEPVVTQTIRVFRALTTLDIKLYPGVVETLDAFKKKGKKIFLLSNAQREFSMPELKYMGIDHFFDGFYFSSDTSMCKPDERVFQRLIEQEKLVISESIMIGNDHGTDIVGAKAVGMDSLYIHNSPVIKPPEVILSKYRVLDGDFFKIRSFLI